VRALTPVELSVGLVLTPDGFADLPPGRETPQAALEAAVLPALRRPPCLVSFSGGRDSSAVLAVATQAARRHGLPDPIPVTIRSRAEGALESEWQESVVEYLALREWVRLEVDDELDLVGPTAQAVLRRHGLLWPFNVHFHVPMLEHARGGAFLTGIGGDEIFASATSTRPAAIVTGRIPPTRYDVPGLIFTAMPERLRRAWREYDKEVDYPWLTPAGRRAALQALARREVAEPRRLERRMRFVRGAPGMDIGTASLRALARERDVELHHPLLDLGVWGAVRRAAPRSGFFNRKEAMRAIFAGMLPDSLLSRTDKAHFDGVFFDRHSRAFAETWNGEGVPAEHVDAGALREHWRTERPAAQSYVLLQAAWLASAADALQERVGGVGEAVPALRSPQPPDGQ
jgi:asparagine synthetase B (glutamine-hydrolysing)